MIKLASHDRQCHSRVLSRLPSSAPLDDPTGPETPSSMETGLLFQKPIGASAETNAGKNNARGDIQEVPR